MGTAIPEDAKQQLELSQKWQELKDLSTYDRPDDPGAWNLLYSLHGIEESCRALVDRQIPALVAANDGKGFTDALIDIQGELGHLLYHVRHARSIKPLVGPDDEDEA